MKKIFITMALASLVALTACDTVREARNVQKSETADRLRGERTAQFSEFEAFGNCFELADLEAIALDTNPDIFQAKQAVVAAQLAVKDIRADYQPTVNAKAAYTRQTNNNSSDGSFHSTGSNKTSIELNLLIYDFGKTDAKLRQALEQLVAAEQQLVSAENTVRFNVRQAYFEVRRAVKLNEVAVQAVDQYKEHFDQMNARREVGKGTKYDCTKAEVDYNNAVLDKVSTENNIRKARADLNLALGFAESPEYALGEGQFKEFPEDVAELMKIAREREPGLAVLRAQERAASAWLDKTIADLYPDIGLNVSAALSGDDLDMPKVWNLIGVGSVAQNIFNGGRNERAIENAVAQLRSARSKVSSYEQRLYAELTQAVLTLERSRKQKEVSIISRKAAAENLNIVTEQFNVGKASSLDRTDAQVSLTQASAALVTSHYDYLEALSRIALLIGEE